MINLHHLIDALPPVVGSMVTLWAVASPRHWFWRSWIVLAFLLLFLLIPAYELIIAGAAQTAVVVGGMVVWRYRKQRSEASPPSTEPTQVSLRTIFLFTVIFAAAMAVLGQFPDAPTSIWIRWMGPGITAGCVTLFAVWLVLGETRLVFRIITAIVLVLLTTAILAWMMTASRATQGWTEMWWLNFETVFSQAWLEKVAERWLYFLPAIATGFISVAAWTLLFRKTGWFNPFGELEADKPRWVWGYRAAWLLVTATISALPLYLFFNLITWSDPPQDDGLKPAYYAHFNVAGAMVSDSDFQIFMHAKNHSTKVLENRIKANQPATERMHLGFARLDVDGPRVAHDEDATIGLLALANARAELATRNDDPTAILNAKHDQLLYQQYIEDRPEGIPALEESVVSDVWMYRDRLTSEQRNEMIRFIAKIEAEKPSWSEVQRQRIIIDSKEHWQNRIGNAVVKLYGREPYEHVRYWYFESRLKVRMMAIDMALYSFNEQYGHLPDGLEQLVPEYFDSLPEDPHGKGPFQYRLTDGQAILYSVGPNGIDEQGQCDDVIFDPPVQQSATP
jgi:hypothetical protein